jgi:hypothetical protein
VQSKQLDLTRRRLSPRRRRRCDVCGRPALSWEIALETRHGDQVDRCLIERRCDRHYWRPGWSGTVSVGFHQAR